MTNIELVKVSKGECSDQINCLLREMIQIKADVFDNSLHDMARTLRTSNKSMCEGSYERIFGLEALKKIRISSLRELKRVCKTFQEKEELLANELLQEFLDNTQTSIDKAIEWQFASETVGPIHEEIIALKQDMRTLESRFDGLEAKVDGLDKNVNEILDWIRKQNKIPSAPSKEPAEGGQI